MNEQAKPGDIVMITNNNYGGDVDWKLPVGSFCKIYENYGLLYAELLFDIPPLESIIFDDLGYYSYEIIHDDFWKLFI